MLSVDEAKAHILKTIDALNAQDVEEIALEHAFGRILAADVLALRDQPPHDCSAMDGYAVRFADIQSTPVTLNLIGVVQAGHAYEGEIKKGQAVRIFTGGNLPKGADTVVMQENTSKGDTEDHIIINEGGHFGRHVRLQGNDFKKQALLLAKGKRLNARDIGLIAAGNVAKIKVTQKPSIAILSTGDELVAPGMALAPHEIVNSNAPMLAELITQAGGMATICPKVDDSKQALNNALQALPDTDILITIGGASVGDYDLVQGALGEVGFKLGFWKVAMRPGKPIIFGTLPRTGKKDMIILGLPGNPVSAMVGAYLFLLPMLDRLLHANDSLLTHAMAILSADMEENGPRQAYFRAQISIGDTGVLTATPLNQQDSAALKSLSDAHALIIRPPNSPIAVAKTPVPVLLFSNFGIF